MRTQQSHKLAVVSAIINASIIGLSFLFMKSALQSADPFTALAYRFILSFLVLSIPVALGWIKINIRGKSLRPILGMAILYPTLFFALQAFGLQHASSAEGGILYAFTPVLTVLFAGYFLKERTTLKQKFAIALSVFGVLFVVIMKGTKLDLSHMAGIILLFFSVLSFSGYSVFARKLSGQFRPIELTYIMMAIGSIAFGAMALVQHGVNGTMEQLVQPLTVGSFWIAILYLGLLSSLISLLLQTYTLSKMEASKMSVFSNLATIVSMIGGVLVFGEQITIYDILGSIMIIVGVIGTLIWGKRNTAQPEVLESNSHAVKPAPHAKANQ
ncbi:DMT family transporter [Paenibacillus guangzhouensis]|uniref:DMT family transporter n=1 Tax=Paenibacillus guangzhouensis TaxID=1473112 RepID=UPI001267402B|nr:DMT family transporter [Paenibacillus guangzhouensis]